MRIHLPDISQGEYARVEFEFSAGEPAPWTDLPPETSIVFRMMRWDQGAVRFEALGSIDAPGPDGKVSSGGAVVPQEAPAGAYDFELEVTAPGQGFPRVAQGTLRILERRAAPSGN